MQRLENSTGHYSFVKILNPQDNTFSVFTYFASLGSELDNPPQFSLKVTCLAEIRQFPFKHSAWSALVLCTTTEYVQYPMPMV